MKAFIDSPLLIYLNTVASSGSRAVYEAFYVDLLAKHRLYTDVLVLDELIYASKRKYGVPYEVTLEFIDAIVLPYVGILELGGEEYEYAKKILRQEPLKPSDALHAGAMLSNNIQLVVSEDKEFDRIPSIRRMWI